MADTALESILVVFQNPVEGRLYAFDDWYTNVHIRDAMRLKSALAVQRFIVHDEQPIIDGRKTVPYYWAHTIYEWKSAADSVLEHMDLAATPAMEISLDGSGEELRDHYYRPVHLSSPWSLARGFRDDTNAVLTAMIRPPHGGQEMFADWFKKVHMPAALAQPEIATAGLFSVDEEQSLPGPAPFGMVAIYGLTDARMAVIAWGNAQGSGSDLDMTAHVDDVEATCWQMRCERLTADTVAQPTPEAQWNENRARDAYRDRYMTRQQLVDRLTG